MRDEFGVEAWEKLFWEVLDVFISFERIPNQVQIFKRTLRTPCTCARAESCDTLSPLCQVQKSCSQWFFKTNRLPLRKALSSFSKIHQVSITFHKYAIHLLLESYIRPKINQVHPTKPASLFSILERQVYYYLLLYATSKCDCTDPHWWSLSEIELLQLKT